MQVTDSNQLMDLEENEFIGELPKMTNSQISFKGKNNILICEEGVHLWNCRIDFNLDDSVLYLSKSRYDYSVNIALHKNSICFIGKDTFFNGRTTFVLSEAKNIILGDGCFISYNVIFRTSDGHCIYHADDKNRLNHAGSIYVGDHVWFGQNAMVFKGSKIGSGAVIGAGSVVSNKKVLSNTTAAGAPLRVIHERTFWTPHSNHEWGEEEIRKMSVSDSDLFVYAPDGSTLDFDLIEEDLNGFSNPDDVVEYLWSKILLGGKNRFALK